MWSSFYFVVIYGFFFTRHRWPYLILLLDLWFSCSQRPLDYLAFPIFWVLVYLMKVIPETCRVHYMSYLRFYYFYDIVKTDIWTILGWVFLCTTWYKEINRHTFFLDNFIFKWRLICAYLSYHDGKSKRYILNAISNSDFLKFEVNNSKEIYLITSWRIVIY